MPASTSSSTPDAIWAVILAGGVGSRFWPVSTPQRPKQLLPLAGDAPLIRDTVDRVLPLISAERIRIVTGSQIAGAIGGAVPELAADAIMVEPCARGTAPALVWAAHRIARYARRAVMISLHSDHVIRPAERFRDVLIDAARVAHESGRLVTLGARPTRAETGYGYIEPGRAIGAGPAVAVARFVEKPPLAEAERYAANGWLWNTGIFAWRVDALLDEIRRHTPELASLLPLLERDDAESFFEQAPVLSIDTGLLERSDAVAVLPAPFEWDDVGAWDAVARTRPVDEAGNVAVGDALLRDCRNTIAWADDGPVVAYGVDDIVVVRANGVTLVVDRKRAAQLKDLLAVLPARLPGTDD